MICQGLLWEQSKLEVTIQLWVYLDTLRVSTPLEILAYSMDSSRDNMDSLRKAEPPNITKRPARMGLSSAFCFYLLNNIKWEEEPPQDLIKTDGLMGPSKVSRALRECEQAWSYEHLVWVITFYGTRGSQQLEAKEYHKVTSCNKPHTRDLLGRNPEWLLFLNRKRNSSGIGRGAGFYRVFRSCAMSQKKSTEGQEVLLCW